MADIDAADRWKTFRQFVHGPSRNTPHFVRDWPDSHASFARETVDSPEAVGDWLRSELEAHRNSLSAATRERYNGYADQVVEAMRQGSDCSEWGIWSEGGREVLTLVVVRERPNPGSPHKSASDVRR